jgi:hypothetical protein
MLDMKTQSEIPERFRGKRDPFLIPEGYFEQSRASIMESIAREGAKKKTRVINLRSRLIWAGGIAASLVVGFILFQNLYLKPLESERIAREIDWFINYSGSDLNSATLAYYAAEEGISIDELTGSEPDVQQSTLLEMTEFDELYIIEEWMKSENQ